MSDATGDGAAAHRARWVLSVLCPVHDQCTKL
jgi:hypothetical protein